MDNDMRGLGARAHAEHMQKKWDEARAKKVEETYDIFEMCAALEDERLTAARGGSPGRDRKRDRAYNAQAKAMEDIMQKHGMEVKSIDIRVKEMDDTMIEHIPDQWIDNEKWDYINHIEGDERFQKNDERKQ